ncbi:MAG: mannose-1-phosphate guanylyltransferase [Chloroflexi bacterium]|nr:mannose-1-phosphate guanylyltransferase [Chloroflexota bacterium]
MTEHYYAVIMAGGGGTRLWPLSRKANPKQMLPLIEDRSLFQIAVSRLDGVFSPEQIFVVTVADQAEKLQAQCPEIPNGNFLIEPMPRGTASVVGMAAVALRAHDPQAVMAVLTADHIFAHNEIFRELLIAAYDAAQQDYLVTLGIAPTHAATGYGYIQRSEFVGKYQELDTYRVLHFIEKPDAANAQKMVIGGDFDWNSGMFVWQVTRILDEFARQMPILYAKLNEINNSWNQPDIHAVIHEIWPTIVPETIDYGIMENARNVVVIPAKDLGWHDVGSWDALLDVIDADENGNVFQGEGCISLKTKNTLIHKKLSDRLVVTIGIDDLIIVDTDDVLLVCKKDLAQEVGHVVKKFKKDSQYL